MLSIFFCLPDKKMFNSINTSLRSENGLLMNIPFINYTDNQKTQLTDTEILKKRQFNSLLILLENQTVLN